jgi:hypothetical protein
MTCLEEGRETLERGTEQSDVSVLRTKPSVKCQQTQTIAKLEAASMDGKSLLAANSS